MLTHTEADILEEAHEIGPSGDISDRNRPTLLAGLKSRGYLGYSTERYYYITAEGIQALRSYQRNNG